MTLQQAREQYPEMIFLCEIPGRGICGLQQMLCTVALMYGLQPFPNYYTGRYCYPNLMTACKALVFWDGQGDPPDEHWIKHKGQTEYSNPKNKQYDSSPTD